MQRMCSARTTRCRRQTQRSPRLRSRNPSAGWWPQRTRSPRRYSLGDLSDPLLIVDGDSIVFRAWFALPASIKGSDGRPVNALLGAANLILRAVEDHKPRAVVVCFGQEAAHYRVELFDGYHAQRPELDPDLAHQYEKVAGFFESFGWTVATHEALEADDLLASYAAVESERGGSALI